MVIPPPGSILSVLRPLPRPDHFPPFQDPPDALKTLEPIDAACDQTLLAGADMQLSTLNHPLISTMTRQVLPLLVDCAARELVLLGSVLSR